MPPNIGFITSLLLTYVQGWNFYAEDMQPTSVFYQHNTLVTQTNGSGITIYPTPGSTTRTFVRSVYGDTGARPEQCTFPAWLSPLSYTSETKTFIWPKGIPPMAIFPGETYYREYDFTREWGYQTWAYFGSPPYEVPITSARRNRNWNTPSEEHEFE